MIGATVLFLLLLVSVRKVDISHTDSRKNENKNTSTIVDGDNISFVRSLLYDVDADGKKESFRFNAYAGLPGEERTEMFLNDSDMPVLRLVGYFEGAFIHDMNYGRVKLLEIRVSSGHSINSLVYRYHKGSLIRIPVSTEQEGFFEGVVSRNAPNFIDVDGDGVKEMIVYHREFPPDYRRIVEVYQLKEGTFEKLGEYEEETEELFL